MPPSAALPIEPRPEQFSHAGARWLAPLFATSAAWRVLDGVTATTMLVLAGVMALS